MIELSIIMPTYNVGEYISKAIESVLRQNFKDWELIIIDDGSTDNSVTKAKEFAKEDNRIKILHKTNGGLSDARNFGLKHSKGVYIHFFDPDDYLEGEFYSDLLKKIEFEKADLIISGYKVKYKSNQKAIEVIERKCHVENSGMFKVDSQLSALKFVCYAWNKLFKREFLISNKLEYEKGLSRIEDAEFMSRVITCNPTVAFLETGEYVYVQRPIQTLSKGFDNKIISLAQRRVEIDKKLIQFFTDISPKVNSILDDRLKSCCSIACINRLYSSSLGSEVKSRKIYLGEIRDKLLPKKFYNYRSLPKSIFDLITYFGIRYKLYSLVSFIQKFR